jgi:hypothetical protein
VWAALGALIRFRIELLLFGFVSQNMLKGVNIWVKANYIARVGKNKMLCQLKWENTFFPNADIGLMNSMTEVVGAVVYLLH